MLLKDGIRIGSLSAAIALGMTLQAAPQKQADWTDRFEEIKPVQVETAELPQVLEHPV
ncbi:hypothetical protein [Leisingera sp. ANG-M1]|uniref:hypothetical protein n=1 Tax=Leisingera sp. ANG-M1 TaxID=1577895 RepID=UPI000ABEC0EB|nr:hypothetical protein [Leisingera sp. ANG-M1]